MNKIKKKLQTLKQIVLVGLKALIDVVEKQ